MVKVDQVAVFAVLLRITILAFSQAPVFTCTLGHSANLPCRCCFAAKKDLFNPDYDIVANQRRQAHHDAFLASIADKTPEEKKKASTATGWRTTPSPLAGI